MKIEDDEVTGTTVYLGDVMYLRLSSPEHGRTWYVHGEEGWLVAFGSDILEKHYQKVVNK